MAKRISVIVAKDVKNGIGNKGSLPWPMLRTDMKFMRLKSSTTTNEIMVSCSNTFILSAYFTRVLQRIDLLYEGLFASLTSSLIQCRADKQNAVIMGRLTWESIPEKNRPLKNRYNIVLTSRKPEDIPGAHMVCSSLESAMESLQSLPLSDKIESVFVLGGARAYEMVVKSPLCDTLYVTDVLAEFEADTFFPPIDTTVYQLLNDPNDPLVPSGELEENGIKFKFSVYKRKLPRDLEQ